jgi:hypothetical protein
VKKRKEMEEGEGRMEKNEKTTWRSEGNKTKKALVRVAVSAVEEVVHGHRQWQHREKSNISGSGSGSGSSKITAKSAMMRKQK